MLHPRVVELIYMLRLYKLDQAYPIKFIHQTWLLNEKEYGENMWSY